MPLMKSSSKQAFKKNVETEMKSNPENKKQDLAIAYSIQRKNRKKMANGGPVSAKAESRPMPDTLGADSKSVRMNSGKKPLSHADWLDRSTVEAAQRPSPAKPVKLKDFGSDDEIEHKLMRDEQDLIRSKAPMYAKGGAVTTDDYAESMIDQDEDMGNEDLKQASLVSRIIDKKLRFADGGQVDLSRNADEDFNNEDQMSFDALRKENYSETPGLDQLDQPEDSNLKGHDLSDEDEHDMVSSIIRKIRSRK